jgi:hypothetical protein
VDDTKLNLGFGEYRGEKVEQRRVFPVFWAWYKDNPAAMVRITNNEPNTVTDVGLSLFMERYMGQSELSGRLVCVPP